MSWLGKLWGGEFGWGLRRDKNLWLRASYLFLHVCASLHLPTPDNGALPSSKPDGQVWEVALSLHPLDKLGKPLQRHMSFAETYNPFQDKASPPN